jgi:hypothetical protein
VHFTARAGALRYDWVVGINPGATNYSQCPWDHLLLHWGKMQAADQQKQQTIRQLTI